MGFWNLGAGDLLSIGSSLFGSLFSAKSSQSGIESMNAANMQIAAANRDWLERMSSTAHQREVQDLRAAGLNPILSATGGAGASTPGGSMIPMQSTQEQKANIIANTAKNVSDVMVNKSMASRLNADTVKAVHDARSAKLNADLLESGIDRRKEAARFAAEKAAKEEAINAKMATWDAIGKRADSILGSVSQFLPFAIPKKSSVAVTERIKRRF